MPMHVRHILACAILLGLYIGVSYLFVRYKTKQEKKRPEDYC